MSPGLRFSLVLIRCSKCIWLEGSYFISFLVHVNAHCCVQPPIFICCELRPQLHTRMHSYVVSSGLSYTCLGIAEFGRIIFLCCELRPQLHTHMHSYAVSSGLSFTCLGLAEVEFLRAVLYTSYAVSSGLSFIHIYIYMLCVSASALHT